MICFNLNSTIPVISVSYPMFFMQAYKHIKYGNKFWYNYLLNKQGVILWGSICSSAGKPAWYPEAAQSPQHSFPVSLTTSSTHQVSVLPRRNHPHHYCLWSIFISQAVNKSCVCSASFIAKGEFMLFGYRLHH